MAFSPQRQSLGVARPRHPREGTSTQADGTTYEGQWKFRERNGHGTLTYPDGRKYIGEFKDVERDGQGVLIYPDGRKQKGTFKNGEFDYGFQIADCGFFTSRSERIIIG